MAEKDPLKIIVCGVGGQGNVVLSRLLAKAFVNKGYTVTVGESYGSAQRGGAVTSEITVSKRREYGPLMLEGKADIIVSLEPMEALRVLGTYGNPKVAVVSNVHPVYAVSSILAERDYPDLEEMKQAIRDLSARHWFLDATQISIEMGDPRLLNMIIVGLLLQTNLVNLSKTEMEDVIRKTFPDKVAEINVKALSRGMQAIQS